MTSKPEPTFVKILETDSLTDIALIKSVLDAEKVEYFIQGENMQFVRPVDHALLLVAEGNVRKAIDLLKPLNLNFSRIKFG